MAPSLRRGLLQVKIMEAQVLRSEVGCQLPTLSCRQVSQVKLLQWQHFKTGAWSQKLILLQLLMLAGAVRESSQAIAGQWYTGSLVITGVDGPPSPAVFNPSDCVWAVGKVGFDHAHQEVHKLSHWKGWVSLPHLSKWGPRDLTLIQKLLFWMGQLWWELPGTFVTTGKTVKWLY